MTNHAGQSATPLAEKLKARIRTDEPLAVADFVTQCLTDREYGYYTTRVGIGARGDFITAPEISQIFGELIGLWCATVWQLLGEPSRLNLVELGPGRGTMLADALRAMRIVPGLIDALDVSVVEVSAPFKAMQINALANVAISLTHWTSTDELIAGTTSSPPGPWLVLANEYLDALAVTQYVNHSGTWHERHVDLDDTDTLTLTNGPPAHVPLTQVMMPDNALDGEIFEYCPAIARDVAPFLTSLSERGPLAALFIDYGHTETTIGETLQAVRGHVYESVLTAPGQADLTAHVDFAVMVALMRDVGFAVDGPVTQAEFLGNLGIIERASRLMSANPKRATDIEAGALRLLAANGMGTRFKAIAVRNHHFAPLPCLQI